VSKQYVSDVNQRAVERNVLNRSKPLEGQLVDIPFHCIRNVTSPEDNKNDRLVYTGQIPIGAIIDYPRMKMSVTSWLMRKANSDGDTQVCTERFGTR
jgi:hypothetical protein